MIPKKPVDELTGFFYDPLTLNTIIYSEFIYLKFNVTIFFETTLA